MEKNSKFEEEDDEPENTSSNSNRESVNTTSTEGDTALDRGDFEVNITKAAHLQGASFKGK